MFLNRLSIRTKITLLAALLAVVTGVTYTLLLVQARESAYISSVDSTLLTAATFAQEVVGAAYHDGIVDESSVSPKAYEKTVAAYNRLCRKLGLSYVWSVLVLDSNTIVFTSATSPSKDIANQDHASFFELHTDPAAYRSAMKAGKTVYATFHNKWGAGRMVLVPQRDAHGRLYMFGASVRLGGFHAMLRRTILQGIGIGLVILVLGMFAGVLLARFISAPIVLLTRASERMAAGDLEQDIPVAGSEEIARLGRSFALMRDAIRRQLAELRSSEEYLSITLDSIGDGVIATDDEGRVSRMNRVAGELTGWAKHEAIGLPLEEVFHIVQAGSRERASNPVEKVLAQDCVVGLANDTVLIARDGTERQIADSGAPIRSEGGEPVGVVLVFRDVTEEHAMREQLEHAQKMQAIGQLAGGVAHDFNNVLTAVMGNAQLLGEALSDRPEVQNQIHDIRKAAARGSDLTRQLLGFARKGKQQIVRVNLHHVIDDVVKLLQHSIDPRIEIRKCLDASRPVVAGDPSQIHNALLNLSVNAVDAMPNGGTLTLSTRSVDLTHRECASFTPGIEPGDYFELAVEDTGVGMSSDTVRRIFEPFFTTKPQGKGTGLGLAGVYGAVQSHHGAIAVESSPGAGTLLRIVLPPATSDVRQRRPMPAQWEMMKGKGRLLVVDDDPSVLKLLVDALAKLGYTTSGCRDGKEALEWYRQAEHKPDLVLLDERMPRMSGTETFEKLKEVNPEIRVIAMSGFTDEGVIENLLKQGVLDFIAKPFELEELSQKIAFHIQRRSLREAGDP